MTDTNDLTAEGLAALISSCSGGKLDAPFGPARFLAELVQDTMYAEDLSTAGALEYIAAKGVRWTAGTSGRIAVRVRERDGKTVTQWLHGDGAWCALGDVLEAIKNGNASPSWYEEGWVEVMDEDDKWISRSALAVRDERAGLLAYGRRQ